MAEAAVLAQCARLQASQSVQDPPLADAWCADPSGWDCASMYSAMWQPGVCQPGSVAALGALGFVFPSTTRVQPPEFCTPLSALRSPSRIPFTRYSGNHISRPLFRSNREGTRPSACPLGDAPVSWTCRRPPPSPATPTDPERTTVIPGTYNCLLPTRGTFERPMWPPPKEEYSGSQLFNRQTGPLNA